MTSLVHQDVAASKTLFNEPPIHVMIQVQDFPIPVMRHVVLVREEVCHVLLPVTRLATRSVNGRQADSAQVESKLFMLVHCEWSSRVDSNGKN